jgi:hypothetical protein
VQRSLAIISVPMIALWLLIGVLAATAMYTVAMVLDDKPAYAKGKGTAAGPCTNPGVEESPFCPIV